MPKGPTGNPKGRPRAYTPIQIQEEWNEYVDECKNHIVSHPTNSGKILKVNKPRVPTIGGFCYRLDITTQTWNNYGKVEGYEEFFDTIKKINDIVKNLKLDALVNGEGNTTGLIFDLKANYGMKETQVQEMKWDSVKIKIHEPEND